MSKHDPYINKLIFSKYLIRKKIGKGSFGIVYQGINTSTNEKIALKVEKREKNQQGTLENEAMRLVYLQGEGIPKVYCYGNNQSHNLLVEELLGKSLEDIFNSYGKPFSLKTVCVLGIEMIKRIQFIHQKYYIHRDIKPDNFMTGRGENEKSIYIIDFGLAKKYYSVSKAQHIKFCTGKHLIGTARYCARNAHRGYEQGRRDDIESIGYVLMYFLLGVLPWQGLKIKKNEDQFEKIAEKKYNTPFEELTEGQPEEFLLYFKYIDGLRFEDQPNYVYLIGLFQNMIDKYCRDCFYDFDWKKDSCTYVSRDLKENKNLDASLIVNKNNDLSGMDYSYEGEVDETGEDNNQEGNNNNINNKKKSLRNKDIFVGEDQDQQPIDEEIQKNQKEKKDKDNDKNKSDKPRRSKSLINPKKRKKNMNSHKNSNKQNKNEQKQKESAKFGKKDNEANANNSNQNKENQQNNNHNINTIDPNNDQSSAKFNIRKQNANNVSRKKSDENKNNMEKANLIKNEDLFNQEPENKDNINEAKKEEEKNNEDLNQTEERNPIENNDNVNNDNINNDNNNNDYNNENNIENDENDMNKNLFNNTSYDDKDSKNRDRNRNKDTDDTEKKKDNIVCRCDIF